MEVSNETSDSSHVNCILGTVRPGHETLKNKAGNYTSLAIFYAKTDYHRMC